MREALVSLFERHPNAAKHTIPSHFILGAFDRHVKARKRRAMAVLRRVMVGSPETITTLVHYKAGRYSALDHTLRRHAIANPFMVSRRRRRRRRKEEEEEEGMVAKK
ncbi:hypothetical protein E2C01_097706 [Portunus trituberculatus]|uniref:Uncharacterized protein n=1 Tax=Portunus trituberculatus TaxID=210409 RepID=A0A5B7K6D9_PORTR|nr:hypothetical protein [Portunus trituberculatus]